MCGLIGIVSKGAPAVLEERATAGMGALAHRGPDDRRLLVESQRDVHVMLGHTRLAIIDLSPGGMQPMSTKDGRFTIVFNGEIYNYVELRRVLVAQGVRFSSESDTEVLLTAWARWGVQCLRRLIGMFAFAVLDRVERSVTLVRDAFGVKPLYHATRNEGFFFASELPALIDLAGLPRTMDDQVAVEYLLTGELDIGPETFIDGVRALLPGHVLTLEIDSGRNRMERWWNPSIAEAGGLTRPQAAEQLRSLFLDSVRLHMRSDVPLGIALSGGVDSSAIACAARHVDPHAELHTFSYIADDEAISEELWVDVVNEAIGATAHKISIAPGDLGVDLDHLVRFQGEPFGGTMIYAQSRVFRAARDAGIKVILEGQGGDELMGGYLGYPGFMFRSALERYDVSGAIRFARGWFRANPALGKRRLRALLSELPYPGRSRRQARRWIERTRNIRWIIPDVAFRSRRDHQAAQPRTKVAGRRLMEALLFSMTRGMLPHLLRYGDRNAMAVSIENRVPFVTTPIAEFMLSLPESFLIDDDGVTKSLFRMAMRGIIPDVVLDRLDKSAFRTPMHAWLKSAAPNRIAALMESRQTTIVDRPSACRFLEHALFQAGNRSCDPIAWRVFDLLLWQSQFDIASQCS